MLGNDPADVHCPADNRAPAEDGVCIHHMQVWVQKRKLCCCGKTDFDIKLSHVHPKSQQDTGKSFLELEDMYRLQKQCLTCRCRHLP